jgi:dihydrofolate synthase / folylpolyglutamate synthase
MQFDEALRYLLGLGHETLAIKLGLKNIELLLATLGDPQQSFPSIQIAGTNGKGSTAVILDSICNAAGIKAGLYTSPHLVSITERIRVGALEVSQDEFAQHATVVRNAAESLVNERQIEAAPTFFEQLTAIAFLAFQTHEVDLAIIETGLGGRLDATSVARSELIAITPIDFDHQEYLGETLKSIAAEKAAIIRPGVTAIIAPQLPPVMDVILKQCATSAVKPSIGEWSIKTERALANGKLCLTFETEQDSYRDVCPGLRGRHQVINVGVAIKLAESLRTQGFSISHAAIIEGIERANHPGRLQLQEGRSAFLFDGAHNPAGARALRAYLEEFVDAPVTMVFGAMRDKNLEEMATTLFPLAHRLILTRPENPRAASLETLVELASSVIDARRISRANSLREAIPMAKESTAPNGLICFTGSLYLIGEAQAILQEMKQAETAASSSST